MLPAGGHAVLLHRLQQRRLRLGRRAVDLVGEHDVGEDRPVDEAERAPAGRVVLLEDVGAGDVRRHQVGRELDAVEAAGSSTSASVEMSSVLARPGHADEQAVAAREQRGEQLIDHRLLADDALLHLGLDLDACARDLLDGAQIGWGLGYHGLTTLTDAILASLQGLAGAGFGVGTTVM